MALWSVVCQIRLQRNPSVDKMQTKNLPAAICQAILLLCLRGSICRLHHHLQVDAVILISIFSGLNCFLWSLYCKHSCIVIFGMYLCFGCACKHTQKVCIWNTISRNNQMKKWITEMQSGSWCYTGLDHVFLLLTKRHEWVFYSERNSISRKHPSSHLLQKANRIWVSSCLVKELKRLNSVKLS